VSAQELLGLLEALVPALESGMDPASALRIAAEVRSGHDHPDVAGTRGTRGTHGTHGTFGTFGDLGDLGEAEYRGRTDPLASLMKGMASAAADGARLGPLWRSAGESAGSAELMLLAQAWSLTEDMGVPLAQAVRTTATLLESRIAHERALTAALAGARATVNVLTILPIGGPLLALVVGIGPAELYGGSGLTQASLVLGLCLAGMGRWWVRQMTRAVARGPLIA